MHVPIRGPNMSSNIQRNSSLSSVAPPAAATAAAGRDINVFVNRGHGPAGDAARHICCAAEINRTNAAPLASATAPPFPWSSKSYTGNHGIHAHAAVRDGNGAVPTGHIIQDSIVELGTTPDTHRRWRHMASPSQHPGDSSLVFAMSEDSELKVLASGVSPPTVLPPEACTSSSNAIHPPLPSSSQNTVSHSRTTRSHVPVAGNTGDSDGGVYAVNRRGSQHHRHGIAGATLAEYNATADTGHTMPHTPSVRRESDVKAVVPGGPHGAPVCKPSVQLSHQQLGGSPGGAAAAPALLGAPVVAAATAPPVYRTSPHELRMPPALQVCAGVAPGSHKARGPAVVTTAPAAAAAAPYTGGGARWPQRHMPSVSLYSASGGGCSGTVASVHSTSRAFSSTTSPHITVGSNPPVQQHQQPAPLQQPQTASAGASNSADARSQHSGTPPPPPASQPLDKNFTEAQRLAVLEEVQQELYLNYPAVPVPDNMINLGDTDERRRRLEQRRKQIIYGKETEGYLKYTSLISRPCDREYNNPLHAITPRPEYDCSKRQFDRVLNAWRRQLHQWDDYDMNNVDERFLLLGKASLLDLGLCHPPSNCTPMTATAAEAGAAAPLTGKPPHASPAGVMHSIANVAAMANGVHGDDASIQCHSRSPVFTENSPTSGLYSSASLSMHISSGRAASMATACTPSRPQLSEGAEGPKVDESFFFHMNSGSSRIASPFHPTYSGTGHMSHGGVNGRSSANSHYPQLMMRNSAAYAHSNANGGTPGSSYANYTGLTPAHRPASRSGMPHHITAIFGSEYELMTPSGLASPAGMPHNPRNGSSPYPLGEPWMPSRRSPCAVGAAHGVGGHHPSTLTLSGVTAANGSGTMMVVGGGRGESPPHTTELALIPSTSLSNGSGFAQSPYGYRVHSPVQPQGVPPQATTAYATPLTRQQSRPSLSGHAHAASSVNDMHHHQPNSPYGAQVGPQQQQQQQRAANATGTVAAAASRSAGASGVSGVPTN